MGAAGAMITGGVGNGVVIRPGGGTVRFGTVALFNTQSGPLTRMHSGLESGRLCWAWTAPATAMETANTKATMIFMVAF